MKIPHGYLVIFLIAFSILELDLSITFSKVSSSMRNHALGFASKKQTRKEKAHE